ncbi:MAG: transferase [Deltaproteobacteria bacterium]|nr:transferase [Deltaproteobacteria bacterium]
MINDIHPTAKIASTVRILGNVSIGQNVILHDFVTIYPNVILKDSVEAFEGAVIGKPPKGTSALARKVVPELKTTTIGRGCVISPHAVIYTDVEIGEETLIGDNASIREQCGIGKNCIISRNTSVNYNTLIGDFTKIMDNTHITGNMRIGSHVFISVLVSTTNDNNMGLKGYKENSVKGPIIDDCVTIGAGANILPGVRIGIGSVVGAGAVVTRDIPAKKLVMGIPARIVRDLE